MNNVLTDVDVNNNKEEFSALLRGITREGFDCEKLINVLENSDFYTAPASTKYHGAYKGGLVDHSLCVYHNLKSLVHCKGFDEIISEDSIRIVALLHDISKMNTYETYYRNVQHYCTAEEYTENPAKYRQQDELGHFCWTKVREYKTRDPESRLSYGNHEETSEYLASVYVPLSVEESVAILKHHASMGWDSAKDDISLIWNNYPLAILLHMADSLAAFIDKA